MSHATSIAAINPTECQTTRRDSKSTPPNLRPFGLLGQVLDACAAAAGQHAFGAHSRDHRAEIGGRVRILDRLREQIHRASADDQRYFTRQRVTEAANFLSRED